MATKKYSGQFSAQCHDGNGQKFIGRFATSEDAYQAYKTFKEDVVKKLARKYHGQIDECIYDAMMEFVVVPFP